jgi:hypothetical protein
MIHLNPDETYEDRMKLELAKADKKIALANAEKAQNDLADMKYRKFVHELYVRYGNARSLRNKACGQFAAIAICIVFAVFCYCFAVKR